MTVNACTAPWWWLQYSSDMVSLSVEQLREPSRTMLLLIHTPVCVAHQNNMLTCLLIN